MLAADVAFGAAERYSAVGVDYNVSDGGFGSAVVVIWVVDRPIYYSVQLYL